MGAPQVLGVAEASPYKEVLEWVFDADDDRTYRLGNRGPAILNASR